MNISSHQSGYIICAFIVMRICQSIRQHICVSILMRICLSIKTGNRGQSTPQPPGWAAYRYPASHQVSSLNAHTGTRSGRAVHNRRSMSVPGFGAPRGAHHCVMPTRPPSSATVRPLSVLHVLFGSRQSKVVRIDARVVMADVIGLHPGGDAAIRQGVGDAVRTEHLSTNPDLAISPRVGAAVHGQQASGPPDLSTFSQKRAAACVTSLVIG